MAIGYTTRMSLQKPDADEFQLVSVLNANSDLVDKYVGARIVSPGVTPPVAELFDGAIVKEKGTGICWVAQKNAGGTYDKSYIQYPYSGAFNGSFTLQSSNVFANAPLQSRMTGRGINCKDTDINGAGQFIAPVTGEYVGFIQVIFSAYGAGHRTIDFSTPGYGAGGYMQQQIPGSATTDDARMQENFQTVRLDKGDAFQIKVNQNSTQALGCWYYLFISLQNIISAL